VVVAKTTGWITVLGIFVCRFARARQRGRWAAVVDTIVAGGGVIRGRVRSKGGGSQFRGRVVMKGMSLG